MALSAKLLEIGKRFLKSSRTGNAVTEPSQAQASVKWLQKALSVIELTSSAESAGLAELKVLSFLRLRVVYIDVPF